jgi:hypothetical protein
LYESAEVSLLAELDRFMGTSINTPRYLDRPTPVQKVGTTGALLGYVEGCIEEYHLVRTVIDTLHTTHTQLGVDPNQTVGPFNYSFHWARGNTWGLVAMHTERGNIGHLDLGNGTPAGLIYL